MNDRDLIAIVLHKREFGNQSTHGNLCDTCLGSADAVLAAIGDRLMPELPDGWWWLDLMFTSDGIESSIHCDPIPGGEKFRGTGPTIPTAIRKALEETK